MVKKKYFYIFAASLICINILFVSLFNLWDYKKYDVICRDASELRYYTEMLDGYIPPGGHVPDEKTAIQVAQAVASFKFPQHKVPFHNTYKVYWDEERGCWIVYIYDLFRRATYVVIDKNSGEIIRQWGVEKTALCK